VAIARLENDGLACVDMSGSLPTDTPTDKRFEILGTEGCIYIDEFRNYLTVNSEKGIEANPGDFVKGMTYPDVMWHSQIEGGVKRLQREFIRCILEERQPSVGVRDGVRATEITLAIIRSLITRRMEKVSYEW
jgi:predicted dehydrogenase